MEQPTWSKDYALLYKLITTNIGLRYPCLVNYSFRGEPDMEPLRDICSIYKDDYEMIHAGVRGMEYITLFKDQVNEIFFTKVCENKNLEWLNAPSKIRENG